MANFKHCSVSVKINGTVPAREFKHEGVTFIEGRKGSEFEISITNVTNNRVLAVVSVDGVGVVDGKNADHNSSGYVINAHSTLVIPGWLLNDKEAAKFVFSDVGQSYSKSVNPHMDERNNNCGVIGVAIWSEDVPPLSSVYRRVEKGINPNDYNPFGGPLYGTGGYSTLGDNYPIMGQAQTMTLSAVSAVATSATSEPVQQSLGTGFGDATNFSTTSSTFKKKQLLETACIFYDSLTGLKKRGIDVSVPKNILPNPFPGSYCEPPKGWVYR